MPSPPPPSDAEKRRQALRRYHVLDTPPEKDFDQIARTVARACDVAVAQITLVDDDRLWYKACVGADGPDEVPLEDSFCVYTIDQDTILVVEDLTQDERFADNPFVLGDTHARFYAGVPLITPGGVRIGTLCVIDTEPRSFSTSQRALLADMAELVMRRFELRSAEAQYRTLFDRNGRPMLVYEPTSMRLLAANDAAVWQYGYAEKELQEMTLTDLTAPEDVARQAGLTMDAPRRRASMSGRTYHQKKKGDLVVVEVEDRPILYEGRTCRLLSMANVTDRVRAEQHAETEQRQVRDLLTSLPGAVFRVSSEGHIEYTGGDWQGLTGRAPEAVRGTRLADLVHPDDRARLAETLGALRRGESALLRGTVRFASTPGDDGAYERRVLHARLRTPTKADTDAALVGTLMEANSSIEEERQPAARSLGAPLLSPAPPRMDVPGENGATAPSRDRAPNPHEDSSWESVIQATENLIKKRQSA